MMVPYYFFRWTPPELSLPERISLGREIAKVGRKPFVDALKRRLGTVHGPSSNKPFTFADVLDDAQKPLAQPPATIGGLLLAIVFLEAALCS